MNTRNFLLSVSTAAAMMALLLPASVRAADDDEDAGPASPFDVAFGVDFKSDYISQGHPQTNGGPAVQPWVEFTAHDLLYAGYWGSNVSDGTTSAWENDLSVGIRPKLGPFDLDFGYTRYIYSNGYADQSGEFAIKASVSPIQPLTIGGQFSFDPDSKDTYAEANASVDLHSGFAVSGALGFKNFGNSDPGETSWDGGVSWSPNEWVKLDARYYGGPEANKAVLTLSLSGSASAAGIFH